MPDLLIAITGPRASGKSYAAARLAGLIPSALVIDEHPWGLGEDDHRYRRMQHLHAPWRVDGESLHLDAGASERVRGRQVTILVATDRASEKVMLLQQLAPCAIVQFTMGSTAKSLGLPKAFLEALERAGG
jgi:hypothetical protein